MEELRRDPAWRLVYADEASVLFARVQDAVGRSPVPSVLPNATPQTLHIDAGEPVDA